MIHAFERAGAFGDDWGELEIRVSDNTYISQGAIAWLAAWGLLQRKHGRLLRFIGSNGSLNYLSRMNLLEVLDWPYAETFDRHAEEGRFVSIRLIKDDTDIGPAVGALCELVLRTFDNGRDLLPAFEWVADELLGNITLHAQSVVFGVLSAQFFPVAGRLDISVSDAGRGIKAAMEESFEVESDAAAIELAVQQGVTRDATVGQGNGLAGSIEIARQNGGQFHLWSGGSEFILDDRGPRTNNAQHTPGTSVYLRLDPSRPVDLTDTFLAQTWSGWSYLDSAARDLDETAIDVAAECLNTGSRGPAKALRLRTMALLPEVTGPVVLNFAKVEFAASSFLDELLGRMAAELGTKEFLTRIEVVNANSTVAALANSVIGQRQVTESPEAHYES